MTLPAEREAEFREHALEWFDLVCPHVRGNKFIPHWPHPKQIEFLGAHLKKRGFGVYECLFGGGLGSAKSDSLLMAAAQYVHDPEYHGILFRKTYTELAEPGALMDRAIEWWVPAGAHWNGSDKIFTFPSGAKISMAYLAAPHDHLRYKGAEYAFTGWDELTHWKDSLQYQYVGISRVRRRQGSKIPLRTLSTANPGGPGHTWVKNRFVGEKSLDGEWVGEPPARDYIHATIYDNPSLDVDEYTHGLMHLHPTLVKQLMDGDWSAREPGDFFRREWFGPMLDPHKDLWPRTECVRIRWWDLAASEKEGSAYTSGVRMARHRSGVRAVEHVRSFKATPGRRDDLIVQTAQADGATVLVGFEIEGGSGGPAQYYALRKRLLEAGFQVVGERPGETLAKIQKRYMARNPTSLTGKAGRADPVAACLERGYRRRGECADDGSPEWGIDAHRDISHQRDGIRLFAGPWTQNFLDVIEGFPDGDTCDEVDAMSGAWAWLEVNAFGFRVPPMDLVTKTPTAELQNVHPEDRPVDDGRDRRGRWLP